VSTKEVAAEVVSDGAVGAGAMRNGTVGTQGMQRVGFWGNALVRAGEVVGTDAAVRREPRLEPLQRSDHRSQGTVKERREFENSQALGGMRNPSRAVSRLPGLRHAGRKVRVAIEAYLRDHGGLLKCVTDSIEQRANLVPVGGLEALAGRIGTALGTSDLSTGPKSVWRAGIVRAFVEASGDPDTALSGWLRGGAPTGVARDIVSRHLSGDPRREIWRSWAQAEPSSNYASVHENEGVVQAEIQRLANGGFVTIYPDWDAVIARFGNVVVSKMAAIIKEREDGTTKLRIIINMLRSHVNEHVRLHERIVPWTWWRGQVAGLC